MRSELIHTGEAGAAERLTDKNGEPAFHLIEPRRMGWREVKMNILVPGEPAVAFGLMGAEVVEDDMDLTAGIFGGDPVHEVQELDPAPSLIVLPLDLAG